MDKRRTATRGGTWADKKTLSANYIKRLILPADFYRHELPGAKIKRPGWNDGGLCPFHSDSRTGNFRINLTSGAYQCFACGAHGGDVLAFAMAYYGISFIEALNRLAREWGLL